MPSIDWNLTDVKVDDMMSLDNRFVNCIQNGLLSQHVLEPTRWRGNDTPHVLDLVISNNENMIDDVQYLAPLGKSDHCVLLFKVVCHSQRLKNETIRGNYNKGNYDAARGEMKDFNWV